MVVALSSDLVEQLDEFWLEPRVNFKTAFEIRGVAHFAARRTKAVTMMSGTCRFCSNDNIVRNRCRIDDHNTVIQRGNIPIVCIERICNETRRIGERASFRLRRSQEAEAVAASIFSETISAARA